MAKVSSAFQAYKVFATPEKSALSRKDFDIAVKHGVKRYEDSVKAGFRPRLGGGPAPHIVGAAGEVVVERLGRLAGVGWDMTPFRDSYRTRPSHYDFEAGGWKIDLKTKYTEREPSHVLVPIAQLENGAADIFLFAKIRIDIKLLGFLWQGDVKRYGEVNHDLPLPAYEIRITRLRPVRNFWEVLRR